MELEGTEAGVLVDWLGRPRKLTGVGCTAVVFVLNSACSIVVAGCTVVVSLVGSEELFFSTADC